MTSGRDEYLGRTKKHIDYDLEAKLRTWWLNNTGGAAKDGITVRDYFAAKALDVAFMRMNHNLTYDMGDEWTWGKVEYEMIAELAYKLADHMMKARVLDTQGEL